MAEDADKRVERRKGDNDRRHAIDRRDSERIAGEDPRRQKDDRRKESDD